MANYCDKATFYADICAYQERKKTNPDEPIPEYSANAIMQMAEKTANRPNFIGYSWRQDMVSDAIYTCIKYYDKFDTTHPTQNPFGYFSRSIWFAFLQRIAKEKKQSLIRGKILAQLPFDTFDVQDQDLDEDFKNSFTEFLQEHNHIELAPKIVKSKRKNIMEECLDSDDEPELDEILNLIIEEVDISDDTI